MCGRMVFGAGGLTSAPIHVYMCLEGGSDDSSWAKCSQKRCGGYCCIRGAINVGKSKVDNFCFETFFASQFFFLLADAHPA